MKHPTHRPLLARLIFRLPLLMAWLLLATGAGAHPGPYNKQGGHVDRSSGQYHCHAEPCFSLQKQSSGALQEAQEQGRAFSLMYRRDDWPHWSDSDNDCRNTRVEVLAATSQKPVRHARNRKCSPVIHGLWRDPYTGKQFTDARQLDIDHRIALAEAHRYGGAGWSRKKKERFANDPSNLVPVERAVNQAKSDLPAHQWMPKNIGHWCDYIRQREAVAGKYGLVFPPREQAFNASIKQQHCINN